ncbi:MAG: hypothetical protein WCA45_11835 [Thiobacillaceae bacterium]
MHTATTSTLIAASVALLFTSAAQAMKIQQFDRMSARDQDDYIVLLLKGAEQVLTDAGRPDQAAQVEKLFTTIEPGDENSLGMVELELNLAAVDKADADNLVKNPDAKPLPVELAMIATLKKNGIILPKSFMHVGDSFQPKDPLSPGPTLPPTK